MYCICCTYVCSQGQPESLLYQFANEFEDLAKYDQLFADKWGTEFHRKVRIYIVYTEKILISLKDKSGRQPRRKRKILEPTQQDSEHSNTSTSTQNMTQIPIEKQAGPSKKKKWSDRTLRQGKHRTSYAYA
jgi:hypothetical protein